MIFTPIKSLRGVVTPAMVRACMVRPVGGFLRAASPSARFFQSEFFAPPFLSSKFLVGEPSKSHQGGGGPDLVFEGPSLQGVLDESARKFYMGNTAERSVFSLPFS